MAKASNVDNEQPVMVVVGLDPGLANLGLGAVREVGNQAHYLDSQLLRTPSTMPQAERLALIYEQTRDFLEQHQPQMLAIEGQYFHQQRDTAFKVGQAVGVCSLVAAHLHIPMVEYGPLQVKQSLVGSGRASKEQVRYMVRAMLNMTRLPSSHHSADALALALTHLSARRIGGMGVRSG